MQCPGEAPEHHQHVQLDVQSHANAFCLCTAIMHLQSVLSLLHVWFVQQITTAASQREPGHVLRHEHAV